MKNECPLGGTIHRRNGSGKSLLLHDRRIHELETEVMRLAVRVAEFNAANVGLMMVEDIQSVMNDLRKRLGQSSMWPGIQTLINRNEFLLRKWTEAEKHIADALIERNEALDEVEQLKKQIVYLESQVSAARMDAFLGRNR